MAEKDGVTRLAPPGPSHGTVAGAKADLFSRIHKLETGRLETERLESGGLLIVNWKLEV